MTDRGPPTEGQLAARGPHRRGGLPAIGQPSPLTLLIGVGAVVFALVVAFDSGGLAPAAPLPGGLGPCLGAECPADPPPISNGPIEGRDANINVFVGGDFTIIGGAAEAEGRVVVMGDVAQFKDPAGVYNVGAVGVGAQVPPPEGSTFLAVGGNTDVPAGQTLTAIRPDPNGSAGDIRGISRTGTGIIEGDEVVFDAAQAAETAPYLDLAAALTDSSQCYARPEGGAPRPPTGTVSLVGTTWSFVGDGTSALQVFSFPEDLVGPGGDPAGVSFDGIPAGATVLVNVLPGGSTWSTNVSFDSGGWQATATRLLWNIPDAVTVSLQGPVQWYGSVLAGNPDSSTLVTTSGLNGRFLATGDVQHGSPTTAGGEEFHWYPFDGDLPECAAPPPTTTPDTSLPDTSIPDTSSPDTSIPDTSSPDTSSPDTTSPPDPSIPDPSTSTPTSNVAPESTEPAPGGSLPATG